MRSAEHICIYIYMCIYNMGWWMVIFDVRKFWSWDGVNDSKLERKRWKTLIMFCAIPKCLKMKDSNPPSQEWWTWLDRECQCLFSKRNSRQHVFLTLLNALHLVASRVVEVCTTLTFQINVGGRNHDGTMLHLLFHSFKPFRNWDLTSPVMIMTTASTTKNDHQQQQQQQQQE